jgi:hypothetical protein
VAIRRRSPGRALGTGGTINWGFFKRHFWGELLRHQQIQMKSAAIPGRVRCAIYTRVSTDQGLDQDFNSLDAQYEAASAYIKSQAHAGWTLIRSRYDDGGYSGGSTDRPNLQQLLDDVRSRKIDVIVVYKVDRLTRSLADFAKLVELFDAYDGWDRDRAHPAVGEGFPILLFRLQAGSQSHHCVCFSKPPYNAGRPDFPGPV